MYSPVSPPQRRREGHVMRRILLVAALAALIGALMAPAANAARLGGPTISSVTFDPNVPCKVYVTYTGRGKNAQIDMWARTLGYTSPTDTILGYDIWAGSESRNGPMASGSYTAVFQLAAGGHLKEFTTWGWAYRVEGVTLDRTLSPTYSFRTTCVFPNFEYTVKFNDGYTGDAGFLPALQQRAKFRELIAEPTPPTRSGYTFAGWRGYLYGYLPYGSIPWDFSSDTMSDYDPLILYAQWTPNQ